MSYFSSVAKRQSQTVAHDYIYISLLLAACFSFSGNPLSGNKKYTKQDNNNTTP